MPIIRNYNKDFFKTWSPEMAYVLGFFAADGYMIRNKRGGYFIDFYSNDREIIEYIRSVTQSSHKITTRIHSLNSNHHDSHRLQVGSKEWFYDLSKMGFHQKKSNTLLFPKIPSEYFSDFVRGYFDGDGSVHLSYYWRKSRKKNYWLFQTNFTSGSRDFLKGLYKGLKSHVMGGSLSQKTDGSFSLAFAARDSAKLHALMYHDSGSFGLQRKLHILQKGCIIQGLRA